MMRFIAKLFMQFEFGQQIVGKLSFVISVINMLVLLSLKLDMWNNKKIKSVLLIIIPLMIISIWFLGYICEHSGFRKRYMEEKFKYIRKDTL